MKKAALRMKKLVDLKETVLWANMKSKKVTRRGGGQLLKVSLELAMNFKQLMYMSTSTGLVVDTLTKQLKGRTIIGGRQSRLIQVRRKVESIEV